MHSRDFKLNYSLRRVNQKIAKAYLVSFLALTGLGGAGKTLPSVWDYVSDQMKSAELATIFEGSDKFFQYSVIFSIFGILLIAMIISKIIDNQIILTAAKCSFLISFFYLLCATMAYMPPTFMNLHKLIAILFMVLSIIYLYRTGLIPFYLERKSIGDAVAESLVYAVFIGFMWVPVKEVVVGR